MRPIAEPNESRSSEHVGDVLRSGGASLLKLYQARFEILLLDLEEEKERLEQRLILSTLSVILFVVGSLLVTAFVIALLWEAIGYVAIGIFAFLYLAAGAAALALLRRRNKDRHPTFEATLQEFEKDAVTFSDVLAPKASNGPVLSLSKGRPHDPTLR